METLLTGKRRVMKIEYKEVGTFGSGLAEIPKFEYEDASDAKQKYELYKKMLHKVSNPPQFSMEYYDNYMSFIFGEEKWQPVYSS